MVSLLVGPSVTKVGSFSCSSLSLQGNPERHTGLLMSEEVSSSWMQGGREGYGGESLCHTFTALDAS